MISVTFDLLYHLQCHLPPGNLAERPVISARRLHQQLQVNSLDHTNSAQKHQIIHTNHHSSNFPGRPTINDNITSGINSMIHHQFPGKHLGIGRSVAEFERCMTFAPSSSGMVIGSDRIEEVIGAGLGVVQSRREFMSSS